MDKRGVLFTCKDCFYFEDDPKYIEAAFPGLTIYGSAYSSCRGDAGICERRDLFLVPIEQCEDFVERTSTTCEAANGRSGLKREV